MDLKARPRDSVTVASPARHAQLAAFAALVASLGDLLLLYVGNSQRSELGLPQAGRGWLWLGGTAGVVAIPLYALGYWSASHLVAEASARAARVFFVCGALVAVLGSAIHGVTAVYIGAGALAGDPLESVASGGPLILTLWGLAAFLLLVASALFVWFVARGATAAPPGAALGNPALLTIALAAAGLPWVLSRSFLTPAAPNIAHVVFFLVCARALRRSGQRAGESGAEPSGSLRASSTGARAGPSSRGFRRSLLLLLAVIAPLGVASKFYAGPAQLWVRGQAGGILYVAFWILIVLLAWPQLSARLVAVVVLGITCALEVLQLWHPPILDAVRGTFIGHALIGSTFSWWDFPNYALGAILGVVLAGAALARDRGRQRS
jgi:hypothetical protein